MPTLGTIQDNVAGLLARSDTTTRTEIARAITRACEYYGKESWWFTESRVTLSCSTGATEYTLSASLVSVIAATVTRNGQSYPISQISEQERLDIQTANLTGTPSWFSVYGDRFIPYPAPGEAYTVALTGHKRAATITATASSNALTNHAEELIEARAAWYVKTYFLMDPEGGAMFKALEQEAYVRLRGMEAQRDTHRLTATYF